MDIPVDVAIVGGGIAGLWLAACLRNNGYSCCLVEADALGSGQTMYAQGIIHGGAKYSLHGELSNATQAIAAMPQRWHAALQGQGEINLRGVHLLAAHQHLWTGANLANRLVGFFASHLMHSRMQALRGEEIPETLRPSSGSVYQLQEPVVDVASVLRVLSKQLEGCLLQGQVVQASPSGILQVRLASGQRCTVFSRCAILLSGVANAELQALVPQQLRPLHMLAIRGRLPALYAHYLGVSDTPRLTITTHHSEQQQQVWYIGGQIAEQGVERSEAQQHALALQELQQALPWLPWQAGIEITSLRVERAEARQANLRRPDLPSFALVQESLLVGWPTKLAFAPLLADQVLAYLLEQKIPKQRPQLNLVAEGLPLPPIASYPWEHAQWRFIR